MPIGVERGEARIVAGYFISGLTALADILRYMPGQKNIVFFSSGISGGLDSDLHYAYSRLCNDLATSNVAVYPINTETISEASEFATGAPLLQEMAAATGGKYLGYIANSARHMEKIQTLTGCFYVLGYPISETWDGKYHKIKVKVTRPGLDIRAQAGYFNPKLFSDYSDLEKQVHLIDLALAENPRSQTPVRFDMRALNCSAVPPDNLGFVATVSLDTLGEVVGTKVEAVSMVFNAFDDIVDMGRAEKNFATLEPTNVYLLSRLSVPPGSYKCRIVLRNLKTGRAAVAGVMADVPERKAKEILLFPPLFLSPERSAVYIGESATKSAKAFLFDPAQYVPYLKKNLKSNSEIWASVLCAADKGGTRGLKLSAFLLDGNASKEISVPLTVIAEKEEKNEKTFFIRLQISDVAPDAYTLRLVAKDPASGARVHTAANIIIE
jgi:hypothetical protein